MGGSLCLHFAASICSRTEMPWTFTRSKQQTQAAFRPGAEILDSDANKLKNF